MKRVKEKLYDPHREPEELPLDRAKVLREIVDKLKRGRKDAAEFMGNIDKRRTNFQVQNKLNRIERLVLDLQRERQPESIFVNHTTPGVPSQEQQPGVASRGNAQGLPRENNQWTGRLK